MTVDYVGMDENLDWDTETVIESVTTLIQLALTLPDATKDEKQGWVSRILECDTWKQLEETDLQLHLLHGF